MKKAAEQSGKFNDELAPILTKMSSIRFGEVASGAKLVGRACRRGA